MSTVWHLSFSSLLLFAVSIAAQNSTNVTDYRLCSHFIEKDPYGPVNSTGTAVIQWPDTFTNGNFAPGDWLLTTTFNDSGQRSDEPGRYNRPTPGFLQGYLTYPESVNASACVYMFTGLNVSSTGDNSPGTSCEGVYSNACITAITDRLKTANTGTGCASLFLEPVIDCNERERNFTRGGFSTSLPRDLGNDTCAISSPPGGISVAEGSRTVATLGLGSGPVRTTEQYMNNFTYYDQAVRQTVIWMVAARAGTETDGQVVCVAPTNVTAGSRVPQGPWPPEGQASDNVDTNSAGRVKDQGMITFGLLVACAAALLIV